MTAPTLYVYCTSPYAAKVAAVLHYKNIAFETVHLDPVTKAELAFLDEFNLKRIVPTLVAGGRDPTELDRHLRLAGPAIP